MIEPNFNLENASKNDKAFWWRVFITTLATVLAVLVLTIVLIVRNVAMASPLARAVGESAVVILTDEPCAVPAVANLKQRSTWSEKGILYEGCWGLVNGFVLMYYADKTVVAIPVSVFARVVGV